jgi:hypothetical protein
VKARRGDHRLHRIGEAVVALDLEAVLLAFCVAQVSEMVPRLTASCLPLRSSKPFIAVGGADDEAVAGGEERLGVEHALGALGGDVERIDRELDALGEQRREQAGEVDVDDLDARPADPLAISLIMSTPKPSGPAAPRTIHGATPKSEPTTSGLSLG